MAVRSLEEVMAARPIDLGPQWYCLYTAPSAERKATADLRAAGYEVYAPLVRRRVRIMRAGRRRERVIDIPLLVRYLFIEMDHDDSWLDVKETDGIQDFLRDEEGRPRRVPRFAVEDLMAAEDMGLFDETKIDLPIFDPGEHVRITEGPFTGFPAIVVKAVGGEAAKVLVNILGGEVPAKIELEHLRRAA